MDPERQATLVALRLPRLGEVSARRERAINDLNLLHATLDANERARSAAELRRVVTAIAACPAAAAPNGEATRSFADAWVLEVFDAREYPAIIDAFAVR